MSTIYIPGAPFGKQSIARSRHGHRFVATKTRRYMDKVAACFVIQRPPMLKGAVELNISEYRQRPAYHFGTGRNAGTVKEQYREVSCVTKPDLSNTLKAIEDALNGLAWVDDAYIIDTTHHKRYANPGEQIGVFVTIEAAKHTHQNGLRPEHRQVIE